MPMVSPSVALTDTSTDCAEEFLKTLSGFLMSANLTGVKCYITVVFMWISPVRMNIFAYISHLASSLLTCLFNDMPVFVYFSNGLSFSY